MKINSVSKFMHTKLKYFTHNNYSIVSVCEWTIYGIIRVYKMAFELGTLTTQSAFVGDSLCKRQVSLPAAAALIHVKARHSKFREHCIMHANSFNPKNGIKAYKLFLWHKYIWFPPNLSSRRCIFQLPVPRCVVHPYNSLWRHLNKWKNWQNLIS